MDDEKWDYPVEHGECARWTPEELTRHAGMALNTILRSRPAAIAPALPVGYVSPSMSFTAVKKPHAFPEMVSVPLIVDPELAGLELLERVRARVKLRSTYNGRPVKLSALALDGREFELQCYGFCEADQSYPEEAMLMPTDDRGRQEFHAAGVVWIASGDVELSGMVEVDAGPHADESVAVTLTEEQFATFRVTDEPSPEIRAEYAAWLNGTIDLVCGVDGKWWLPAGLTARAELECAAPAELELPPEPEPPSHRYIPDPDLVDPAVDVMAMVRRFS